MKKNAIINLGS